MTEKVKKRGKQQSGKVLLNPEQAENGFWQIKELIETIHQHLCFCQNTLGVIYEFELANPTSYEKAKSVDDTYGWILCEAKDKMDLAQKLLYETLLTEIRESMLNTEKAAV